MSAPRARSSGRAGSEECRPSSLRPNARNPRRVFSNAELDELAASLRERGIIQPIVARPVRGAADAYEIIAGERRWRAAQRAGLHEVPVVIIEATDAEALQLAIIENVQRADLNPLEEAEGYRALIREFSHSQDEVARMVGKSRSHVANTLRLQTLPDRGQGPYPCRPSQRRPSARVGGPSRCRALGGRNRRARPQRAPGRRDGARGRRAKGATAQRPQVTRPSGEKCQPVALEKRMSDALGLAVSIDNRGRGGVLTIRYRSLDQLDEVVRRLEKKH